MATCASGTQVPSKHDLIYQNFEEDGDVIEFRDVTIVTPASPPVKLVEHLSFRLEKGSSILLTGHNGAGKSSIFRCMGGLWSIPTGTIVKPGQKKTHASSSVFCDDAVLY